MTVLSRFGLVIIITVTEFRIVGNNLDSIVASVVVIHDSASEISEAESKLPSGGRRSGLLSSALFPAIGRRSTGSKWLRPGSVVKTRKRTIRYT